MLIFNNWGVFCPSVYALVMQIGVVYFLCFFFSAWSFGGFSCPPQRPMTSNFEGFLYQILYITLFAGLLLEVINFFQHFSIFLNETCYTNVMIPMMWRYAWQDYYTHTSNVTFFFLGVCRNHPVCPSVYLSIKMSCRRDELKLMKLNNVAVYDLWMSRV